MRVRCHIILLIMCFAGLNGLGQNTGFTYGGTEENSNRLEGKLRGTIYHISSLSNSNYFLQKEWTEGTIFTEDGDVFEKLKMRYLAKDDQLVVYNDNIRTLYITDKENVSRFVLQSENGEQEFVKLYFEGLVKGFRYFQRLYSGSRSLLAFHFIEEIKVAPFTDDQGTMRDTQYRMSVSYFMYSPDSGFIRLQKGKKAFLKLYPERKSEIRKLFRKNVLTVFDEKGMKLAFTLLDEAGLLKN